MTFRCCHASRRPAVIKAGLNGIDYLEVVDRDVPVGTPRQRTLLVRCLREVNDLGTAQVRLEGGDRITGIAVEWATPATAFDPRRRLPADVVFPRADPRSIRAFRQFCQGFPERAKVLVVRTAATGDFSTYRLCLQRSPVDRRPPEGFDPLSSAVDFSFKIECPADFDCAPPSTDRRELAASPAIDYLARDYASFRQLLLDRMAALVPEWQERNAADLGITLVELLAYVGDQLSYRQDAIATEAYLGTARQRISVRRHARLVDYFMHEGCNARAWVQVRVAGGPVTLPMHTRFLTRVPDLPERFSPGSIEAAHAEDTRPAVFESMHEAVLRDDHGELRFHTWSDSRSCLPQGATRATLAGHHPHLQPGDVLVLKEVIHPQTGAAADADHRHRHAVRLVKVEAFAPGPTESDPAVPLQDPVEDALITEIEWSPGDALPFALAISGCTDAAHGTAPFANAAVALGNIVLADHGSTVADEAPARSGLAHPPADPDTAVTPRFRLTLARQPLTHAAPLPLAPVPDPRNLRADERERDAVVALVPPADANAPEIRSVLLSVSAASLLQQAVRDARPAVLLDQVTDTGTVGWRPVRDLLDSSAASTHFVVEIDNDGVPWIRFGDDEHGQRPNATTGFTARYYRVGNGAAGNIGAESIVHVESDQPAVLGAGNPLPAAGGAEPESIEEVRQAAPAAFQQLMRAVTEDDYAELAQRPRAGEPADVQRAAATFRWTGSWHTAFVAIDRLDGLPVESDTGFMASMRRHLEEFRLAGHDLKIEGPCYVGLEMELAVTVQPDCFREPVRAALAGIFHAREDDDGRHGLFHPDNFTFGQVVRLSPFVAAAQAVPGVESVRATVFRRQGTEDTAALDAGRIELHRMEVARLDNDPNHPEYGVFRLVLGGGR